MKDTTTNMWASIALLLFVVSIGILLKIMHLPPYGTDFIKNIFQ